MGRAPLIALAAALLASLAACGGGGGTSPPAATAPVATAPVATAPAAIPYQTGLSDQSIMVGGVQRQFLVYVPAGMTGGPRALVLVLHGGTGSGAQAANLTVSPQAVFRTVADREKFVVIFPTGLDNNWNDCRGDAPALRDTGDDVAFFDALLTRLQGELGLDARRTFLSGTSNGAIMSMRYAFERPDRIAGIAISSGNLPAQPKPGICTDGPSRPTPILMTHGTLDPLVPFAGGCVALPLTGGVCTQGTVVSADATRDRWLRIDGLTGVAPQTAQVEIVADDGGPANQSYYPGGAPVERWRLEGAGHSPPSRTVFLTRDAAGTQNRDIEFAEVAWTFFQRLLP